MSRVRIHWSDGAESFSYPTRDVAEKAAESFLKAVRHPEDHTYEIKEIKE